MTADDIGIILTLAAFFGIPAYLIYRLIFKPKGPTGAFVCFGCGGDGHTLPGSARSVKAKDGGIHDHGVCRRRDRACRAVVVLTMQLGVFVLIGVVVLGIVVDSDGSG